MASVEAVGFVTSRITSVEQTVNAFCPQSGSFAAMEETSALSLHVHARLKQMQRLPMATLVWRALGTYMDIVMVPQPLGLSGPMANRNTRRGLDTFFSPEDEEARITVFASISMNNITWECLPWFEKFWATTSAPALTHQNSLQNRFFVSHSKQEPNVRTLWFDSRVKVHIYAADSPFFDTSTKITVRLSESFEDREIGRRFAPPWEGLTAKLARC